MIRLDIPGYGKLALSYLVLDYNGTLAVDGHTLEGAHEELVAVAEHLEIHVVTGNTHGDSEGLAIDAVRDADILVRHVVDGLGLLLHPTRLIASMRA